MQGQRESQRSGSTQILMRYLILRSAVTIVSSGGYFFISLKSCEMKRTDRFYMGFLRTFTLDYDSPEITGCAAIKEEWSSVFSYRAFYILSESMEPVLHKHQIVFGKLARGWKSGRGQIYAYQRPWGREVVIHRLVEITEEGTYLFQGDNNDVSDEAVGREQIGYHILGFFQEGRYT